MRKLFLLSFLAFLQSVVFAGDSVWMVESSKLSYHVDHPFHNTIGTSTMAKGKGVCSSTGCDFLVAATVKSFDSGDTNRDLHMLQAVNGGDYPMVTVRLHLPSEPAAPSVTADLTVDMGGKQIVYPGVKFDVLNKTADHFQVRGVVPLQLTKHNVKRPSLLGVAVKDNAPVDVLVDWKKGS